MVHKIRNPLLMNNVSRQLKSISGLIASANALDIDLSEVENIDSAGIAFLLEIKALALAANCKISFNQIPPGVTKFCQLYQVTL